VGVEQLKEVLDGGDELLGAVQASQQPADKLVRRWSLLVLPAAQNKLKKFNINYIDLNY
jgi:hypothetical protein